MRKDTLLTECIKRQPAAAAKEVVQQRDWAHTLSYAAGIPKDAAAMIAARIASLETSVHILTARVGALEAANTTSPHLRGIEKRNEAFYGIDNK